MVFPENGMHVTDVEVLGVSIDDEDIAALLGDAQHEAVAANIAVLRARRGLELAQKQEAINRGEAEARAETAKRLAELEIGATADRLRIALAIVKSELDQAERAAARRDREERRDATPSTRRGSRATRRARSSTARSRPPSSSSCSARCGPRSMRRSSGSARRRAASARRCSHFGNQETLAKVAEAMSVQTFVGGKTLVDVIDKVFAGTPLAGVMDRVKAKTLTNGRATPG